MIDFHSHIIPKIDDGSRSTEMSKQMLHLSYDQGIRHIVATPHFYINQNEADEFLKSREYSIKRLETVLDENMPHVHIGAEVYFFNGISSYDKLDLLTIDNTNCILIEMPFAKWNIKILDEIDSIINKRKLNVIIAHIERYLDMQKGTNNINELLSLNPFVQMNGEYINNIFTRKKALNFIKDNIVQLIGSDCHNMDKRKPNLNKTYEIIENKLGNNVINNIYNIGKNLLNI